LMQMVLYDLSYISICVNEHMYVTYEREECS